MPLVCSLSVNGPCGKPATRVLIAQRGGETAMAFPRCDEHPIKGYRRIFEQLNPGAVLAGYNLPSEVDLDG